MYLLEDVSPSEFVKGTDEGVTAAKNADGGSGIVEQIFCSGAGDNKARQPLIQADSWRHAGRTQKPHSVVCCWAVPGGGGRRRTVVDGGEDK